MAGLNVLDAWCYGVHVAQLVRVDERRIAWEWTDDAVRQWGSDSRVVSHLLPVGQVPHPLAPKVFLDGYLPEGSARVDHGVEAGVEPDDTFGLVSVYGRDLAGALVVVPAGGPPEPDDPGYQPLTDDDVADRLRHTGRRSGYDSYSSLPGVVPKVLLHRDGDQWFAPQRGAPSTWIVKRGSDEGPASDIVATEVLSLRVARRLGLTNVDADVVELGGLRGIAVRRYDRAVQPDGTVRRLHQEDLAQAIGLNTDDPARKAQRGTATIPSWGHAAKVLAAGGARLDQLFGFVVLNHLLGNTDLHAKNVSFVHPRSGGTALAPAYDIAMHLHSTTVRRQVALQVNHKSAFDDIGWEDLVAEGHTWGLADTQCQTLATATVNQFRAALDAEQATDDHPGVCEAAWQTVRARAAELSEQLAAAGADVGQVDGVGSLRAGRPVRGHHRRGRS
ncbi:MAG: HipA domain-containing protein [Micrococcales bacterium]|nr:HipA domain-containing protein [Micrococcales bacterium]MCL2666591.1 HipA domain-containing protein [Micrococcales bacterium]